MITTLIMSLGIFTSYVIVAATIAYIGNKLSGKEVFKTFSKPLSFDKARRKFIKLKVTL